VSEKRARRRLHLVAPDPTARHPEWPFPRPTGPCLLRRSVPTRDPWGKEGTGFHSVVRLELPSHFAAFHIPAELRQVAIFQHEDYSGWPDYSTLEIATIGVMLEGRPPDDWIVENDNRFLEYDDGSIIPYILATYRAIRLRDTIGYGVAWSPPETGRYIEQRIEGFNVRTPGFKPRDLDGAIEALSILGGIKPATDRAADEKALEEAVRLARSWIRLNSGRSIGDFGRNELATINVVGRDAIDMWMKRHRFNEGKVHQRYIEQFGQ